MDAGNSGSGRAARLPRLIGAALLGALCLAGICLALLLSLDFGRFENTITGIISREIGRELRIDGNLSVRMGEELRIRASGLRLADAEWAGSEPMLEIGRLDVVIDSRSLLSGPLRFRSLALSDVTAVVRRDDRGTSNWQLAREDSVDDAPRDGLPILFDRLEARGIDIVVDEPALRQPARIRLERVEHGAAGDASRTSLTGTVNGRPLALESALAPRSHIRSGEEVGWTVSGGLGQLGLTASARFDDLRRPSRPDAELTLEGPSVGYLFDLLDMEPATTGPFRLTARLARRHDGVSLETAGTIGEFRFGATGSARSLATLEAMDLSFEAAGPDLGRIGDGFRLPRLPRDPFELVGRIARTPAGFAADDIVLEVGGATLSLDGVLIRPWPFDGDALTLSVRGDDVAAFREMLGIPGVLSGPFAVSAVVLPEQDQHERIFIEGTIDDVSHTLTIHLTDARDLAGSRLDFDVSGPDLSVPARGAGLEAVPALPFRVAGSARYRVDRVELDATTVTVGDTRARVSGVVDTDFPGSSTRLAVDMQDPRLGPSLELLGLTGWPDRPIRLETSLAIDPERLVISDLDAVVGDARLTGSGSWNMNTSGPAVEFDVTGETDDLSALGLPEAVWLPPPHAARAKLAGSWRDDRLELRDAAATLGRARLAISGVIDGPPGLDATQIEAQADIPDLSALGVVGGRPLPELPLGFSGRFRGEPDTVRGEGLEIQLGDSRAYLDLGFRDAAVPLVELALSAPQLDLTPFWKKVERPAAPQPKGTRVVPNVRFPLEWLTRIDLDASARIDMLITPSVRHRETRLHGRLSSGALEIDELTIAGRRGSLSAWLRYVPGGDGYELKARIAATDVAYGPADEPEDVRLARPVADITGELIAHGDDLHSLLSTANGEIVIDGGAGELPNAGTWIMGMYTGDLLTQAFRTINPFAKRAERTVVECQAAVLAIRDGVVSGRPLFVMRTRELDFFVSGAVDMTTEALDLNFASRPRKGLGISLGQAFNPYTKITGTLAAPRLGLDEEGVLVQGGAAVATGGLSVLARVLRDRFLSNRDPCEALLASRNPASSVDAEEPP